MADIGLEVLDVLNFDLKDEKAFKRVIKEKELVKGVPFSYDAYTRLLNLERIPFNRTSQLAKEWLVMRLGNCDFKEKNGAHIYTSAVPEKQPGRLRVEVEKDNGKVYCHVVRIAEWRQNDFIKAQLLGAKMTEPLESLIGIFGGWAETRMPVNEVRKEISHYFSHLAGSHMPPYGFAGFLTRKDRSVLVKVDLRTFADNLEVAIDMGNYKMS